MSVAMFSVAVALDEPEGADPKWTITCDRCGRELDALEDHHVVFRVKGFDEMRAMVPDVARRFIEQMREAWSTRHPMIVDSETEVEQVGKSITEALITHARTCSRS